MSAMDLAAMLARIPFLGPLGVEAEIGEDRAARARMPFSNAVANYVGIVHAGALFTLAETAAGVAAHALVADLEGFVLLRGAIVRYTRRAEGDTTATARVDPAAAAVTRATFQKDRRADVAVDVAVAASTGETVFEGTFDYALRPRKP